MRLNLAPNPLSVDALLNDEVDAQGAGWMEFPAPHNWRPPSAPTPPLPAPHPEDQAADAATPAYVPTLSLLHPFRASPDPTTLVDVLGIVGLNGFYREAEFGVPLCRETYNDPMLGDAVCKNIRVKGHPSQATFWVAGKALQRGLTRLHAACSSPHATVERIKWLIARGADPTMLVPNPLWCPRSSNGAAEVGSADLSGFLRKHSGSTPAMLAFECGNLDVARYLLAHHPTSAVFDAGLAVRMHDAALLRSVLNDAEDRAVAEVSKGRFKRAADVPGLCDMTSALAEQTDLPWPCGLSRSEFAALAARRIHLSSVERENYRRSQMHNWDTDVLSSALRSSSLPRDVLNEVLLVIGSHPHVSGIHSDFVLAASKGLPNVLEAILARAARCDGLLADAKIAARAQTKANDEPAGAGGRAMEVDEQGEGNHATTAPSASWEHPFAAAGGIGPEVAALLSHQLSFPGAMVPKPNALFAAFEANSMPCIEVLLKYGADINEPARGNTTGSSSGPATVAWVAAMKGHLGLSRYVANNPFVILPGSRYLCACACDDVDVVSSLFDAGLLTIESLYEGDGVLAFNVACHRSSMRVVKYLIDKGVDVNKTGIGNWTPIFSAACACDWDMTMLLISAGADINAKKNYGPRTPLDVAYDQVEMFSLVTENKEEKSPRERSKGSYEIATMLGTLMYGEGHSVPMADVGAALLQRAHDYIALMVQRGAEKG
jgi:ankyrin repeat protein